MAVRKVDKRVADVSAMERWLQELCVSARAPPALRPLRPNQTDPAALSRIQSPGLQVSPQLVICGRRFRRESS